MGAGKGLYLHIGHRDYGVVHTQPLAGRGLEHVAGMFWLRVTHQYPVGDLCPGFFAALRD